MKPLPKKKGPQLWVDVPLFGEPDPEPEKPQRSRKQDDDAAKVRWRRRPKNAKQISCEDCVVEQPQGKRMGIGLASYIRIEGLVERYLCLHHRAEYGFREDLDRKKEDNVPPPVPAYRRPYRFPRRRD
jgi:hypothetical protein